MIRAKIGPLGLFRITIRPFFFTACFGGLLWPFRSESVWVTGLVAGLAYLFLLWLFGELRRRQLEQLGLVKER